MLASPIVWRQLLVPEKRRWLWICQMAYVAVLCLAFALIWPRGGRITAQVMGQSANAFLTWLLWIQGGLFCLVAPPLVAASIAVEREQGSLDLLLLSPLGPGNILLAKCLTHFYMLGTVFLSGLPIFMLGLFMGGLSPGQLYWCVVILGGLGLLACSAGALSGAMFASTLVAMVGGYVILGLAIGVIPLLLSYLWAPAWYLLSPFGMVGAVIGAAARPAWATFGNWVHVLCWLGLSALLLSWGRNALVRGGRGDSRRIGTPGARADYVWKDLNLPRQHLIAWREIRGRLPTASPAPLVLILVLFASIGFLDFVLWQSLSDSRTNMAATLALCVAVQALTLFMSTASMVNERRKGDLDLLVMTRLEAREIVRGKFNGILATVSPFLLLPVVQGCLGQLPWNIMNFLLACLILYAMTPAAILTGIESGMRSDDLPVALSRAVRRWLFLLLIISAKFLFVLLIPVFCLVVFAPLALVAAVVVFLVFRFANDYLMGPVVDNYLASQIAKGGTDTEWHGEDWEIGRIEVGLAAVLWAAVGVFVASYSGRLIGVFVLFLLGTGTAVAAVYGAVWLARKYREMYGWSPPKLKDAGWGGI